jgi:hypothetical protein
MKKYFVNLFGLLLLFLLGACEVVNEAESVLNNVSSSTNTNNSLSNDQVISGLREALSVGINNATSLTSKVDGFLGNPNIKIPFPPDAEKVREKAVEWGMQGQVDKIVTTLNRAAEEASKTAAPIFLNAIKSMTISDGFSILNGGDGAATRYLKDKTTTALKTAFLPEVKKATEKVQLTNYWNPVITKYNQAMTFTGGQKINPDLNDYILGKAIDGLFSLVEKEENKIRKDPAARITEILKTVFGSLSK